jgi:hypothetical protein
LLVFCGIIHAGVYDGAIQGFFAPNDVGVFLQGVERERLQLHGTKVGLVKEKRRPFGPPFFILSIRNLRTVDLLILDSNCLVYKWMHSP